MNASVTVLPADLVILDAEKTVRHATEFKAQAVEKPKARDCFDRRLDVGHTVDGPVIEYALDDVGVVALNPVNEFLISAGETLRRAVRTVQADGSQVGVQAGY